MTVLEEVRSLRHVPECATGARAETRGRCDCSAADKPAAWVVRLVANEGDVMPMLLVVAPEPLTSDEASLLAQALPVMGERSRVLAERRRKKLRLAEPPPRVPPATCPKCSTPFRHLLADCDACGWQRPMNNEPTNT